MVYNDDKKQITPTNISMRDTMSQRAYSQMSTPLESTSSNNLTQSEDSQHSGNKKVTIPKIIMQTWKNNDVPPHWRPSVESIKKYMPDWEYVLMTDDDNRNLIKQHFPDFLPYYDKFPYPIQRADACRAVFLYLRGGIYMDLDFELLHPLDDLFTSNNDAYFVCSGNIGSCVTNSFMASKPGHPFWLNYIEEMKKPAPSWALTKHFVVMNTTGPLALTRALKNSDIVYGTLPTKLIMPCSVCNIDYCDASSSYLKPLKGQSWNSFDSLALNFLLCNWRKLVMLVLLIIIVIVIWYLIRRYGYL